MAKLGAFLVIPLIILLCLASLGSGVEDGIEPAHTANKMHARKLLVGMTLDYDYGGPNTRHDPRKGKPGIGGKNP